MKKLPLFISFLFFISNGAFASDYPKSPEERKSEEMGSILGGEGLTFRPSKIRNTSTKTDDSCPNSYLWNAAKDIVEDIAPISQSDKEDGALTTEWYSDKKDPKRSLKIKIKITDSVISPESIKTELKSKVHKDGRWLEDSVSGSQAMEIEDSILRRARQLYIRKSGKK
jgi:hypothetical protein